MSVRAVVNTILRGINEPPEAPGRRLVGYYLSVVTVAAALAAAIPQVDEFLRAGRLGPKESAAGFPVLFDLELAITMIAALVLMIPTAWVYGATRRARGYDQTVVQTMLVLPIAVAGIIMVVQNSLALAFSLAGVVAAVRFRSTLKDSSDMLYIFLAIAIGLATGVQALVAATLLSATFNLVTLAIWHCGVDGCPLAGQEHAHGAGRLDRNPALPARVAAGANGTGPDHARKKKRRFDAILSIQALELTPARRAVEEVLAAEARRWQIDEITHKKSGRTMLRYVIRLDADRPPEVVLDTLLSRGAPHVVGATLR